MLCVKEKRRLVKRDVEAVIRSNEDYLRTFCQESGDESCLSGERSHEWSMIR